MKSAIVVAVSIAVLLMLGATASAGTAARIRAFVPFDYHVGEESLPAGDYIFELRSIGLASSSSSIVVVRRPDGTMASMIPTIPSGWNYGRTTDCHLHFTRLTNSYFLAKVEAPEVGADLRMSKAEKELRAQNQNGQDLILLAQR